MSSVSLGREPCRGSVWWRGRGRNEPKKEISNIEQGMANAQVRNPGPFIIGTSLLDIGYSSGLKAPAEGRGSNPAFESWKS
jgi:hypothetical protein